jgi:hypothetical protein
LLVVQQLFGHALRAQQVMAVIGALDARSPGTIEGRRRRL